MKYRSLILVDLDLENFSEVAEVESTIKKTSEILSRRLNGVVYFDAAIKERRGDSRPDLSKLKIRTS